MPPQDGTPVTWEHAGAFWPVGPASPDANSPGQSSDHKNCLIGGAIFMLARWICHQ
jgi:hypothetical protein